MNIYKTETEGKKLVLYWKKSSVIFEGEAWLGWWANADCINTAPNYNQDIAWPM